MKSDPCSTPTQHPRHTGPDHQPTLRVKAPRPVSKQVTPATRPAPPVSSVSKPAPRGRAPGYRSRVSTGRRGGTGRVTISDIAERAGVSIGAVSFALNGRKGVSD